MSAVKGLAHQHGKRFLILCVCFLVVIAIVTIFEDSVSGVRQMAPLTADPRILPHHVEELEKTSTADGMSRNSPTRVLLVAYYRSGSTLAASIFGDFKEAFYSFEPLRPLYRVTIKNGRPLTYFTNGTSKCPDGEDEDRPIAKAILSAAFDCRFQDFDVDAIKRMPCGGSSGNSSSKFCECKKGKTERYILKNCIPDYSKLCLKSAYRAIKTIRVDMDMVESLLKIYPDLKIIHVLRDPRGRVCSSIVSRKCNVSEKFVQQVCEIGTRDVLKRKQLEDKYPGSFKEVIYEDMVAHPIRVPADMFTFVGEKLPNYIKDMIQNKRKNSGSYSIHDRGSYGTYRKNELGTAYKWSKIIPWSVMEHVNRHCETFLELGKFPKIRTMEELLSFQIPDR